MEGYPFGRYRLIDLLGRGGMGEVWRAFDTQTDRIVAVKVLREEFANDEHYQLRFRREARAAAILDEPHVIPIHNFGDIDGRLYVEMRLIQGRDLDTILEPRPMEPMRAVGIISQVASALNAAHQTGLMHRDVKPSNILVTNEDFAYLIDFGIARMAEDTNLTNAGTAVGTLAYMAPERFTSGPVDARADVYALACVLHQTLTGQQPYPGNSMEQQIAGHMATPPPRPSTFRDDVPAELDAVIAAGMAKDPRQRFSTATELARAATDAIAKPGWQASPTRPGQFPPSSPRQPVHGFAAAPPTSWSPVPPAGPFPPQSGYRPPPPPPWWQRPGTAIVGLAALVVVAIVITVVALSSGHQSSDAAGASNSTSSTTSTSRTRSTATTATTTVAPPAPNFDTLLLTVPEIDGIMDATAMAVTKGGDGLLEDEENVTPPECRAAALVAGKVTFEGTTVVDSQWQILSDAAAPGGTHSMLQHVALVDSPAAATKYFQDQARIWASCQNKQVTTTNKQSGQSIKFDYFGFVQGPAMISYKSTAGPFTCQRALGTRGAYLADVSACSYKTTNQGETAANAILTKAAG